jgi:hypothetical protein
MNGRTVLSASVLLVTLGMRGALAHDGPPFPIVSDRSAGDYIVSIWTDPDTTDDGSPGGQFWVMLARRDGSDVTRDTRATVSAAPLDRAGAARTAVTAPVRDDPATQFASVVLDHEGRFRVRVVIDGTQAIESEVAATYDLRPAPALLFVYLLPFVLVGLLWTRLLVRRSRGRGGRHDDRMATKS